MIVELDKKDPQQKFPTARGRYRQGIAVDLHFLVININLPSDYYNY
jgi:hypothetical protein